MGWEGELGGPSDPLLQLPEGPKTPQSPLTKQPPSPPAPLFPSCRDPDTPDPLLSDVKCPRTPFPLPKMSQDPLRPPEIPLFPLKNQPTFPSHTLFISGKFPNPCQASLSPHRQTPDPFHPPRAAFSCHKPARGRPIPALFPHTTTPGSPSRLFPLRSPFFPLKNHPRSPSKHPFYLTK